jgi:hypothetical protein
MALLTNVIADLNESWSKACSALSCYCVLCDVND